MFRVMSGSTYGAIVPYIFQSSEFVSELIGNGVDGDSLISDLGSFRSRAHSHGVPTAVCKG